jgi:hypothetical protein
MGEQAENLERVGDQIALHIVAFAKLRLEQEAPDFRMDDLVEFVRTKVPTLAPDSASRVLRDLRQHGALGYIVVSRRGSHYRLLSDYERVSPKRRKRGRPVGTTNRKRGAVAFWFSLGSADQTSVTDLLLVELRKLPFGSPEGAKLVAARELLIAYAEGSSRKQLTLDMNGDDDGSDG